MLEEIDSESLQKLNITIENLFLNYDYIQLHFNSANILRCIYVEKKVTK